MKKSGGKRSVDAAALRSKLAELEGLRAELQAKYDRLLAEREALKRTTGEIAAALQVLPPKASRKVAASRSPVRTAKKKNIASTTGKGKVSVNGKTG